VRFDDPVGLLVLVLVGALASGINSVAGGGSLLSFPTLTIGFGVPLKEANATNAVGLWPGSLSGALGFWNVLPKTRHYLKALALPTLIGSIGGAWLLIVTGRRVFESVVPWLLFVAALLLFLQPRIKAYALEHRKELSPAGAILLQLLVSVYGGYFGAGMGIMMLATFALFMEGNIHEINAVKTVLGVIINLVASIIFVAKGMVILAPAVALTIGSLIGGFAAARWSQRVDSEKLRVAIAIYGFAMAFYFAFRG
jgi:uncharacterized protein